jgi:hypothetical protein
MNVLEMIGMEETEVLGSEGAGDGVALVIGFRLGTFASDTGVMGITGCGVIAVIVAMSTVVSLRPRECRVAIVETDDTGEVDRKSL